MRFVPPPLPRRPRESVVPMINVVFLLLIFFLMSAQITPPDPFPLTLPDSDGVPETAAPGVLYISANAELHFEGITGDAALPAAARATGLSLRADSGVAASELARVLARLAALGAESVQLIAGARP